MISAMPNDALLDEKDRRILALQKTVDAFKKYDGERTKYLQKIQDELEDYSERYLMLLNKLPEAEKDRLGTYARKVSSLKTQVKALEKKISACKELASRNISDESLAGLERVIDSFDIVKLKEENEKLKRKCETHKEDLSRLITRVLSLERQLGKIKEMAETC